MPFTGLRLNSEPTAGVPSPQHFLEALREAGETTATDKITIHHYDLVYARALQPFMAFNNFALLEIGYGNGAGLLFWNKLFPQAFVYCLDRDHGRIDAERACVLRVDQSDPDDLERAIGAVRHPIDLIVDDGSHHPDHQLLSFSILFKDLLQPGGTYIVEDIETSYWRRGVLYGYSYSFGFGERRSMIEAAKLLVDFVNRRFLDPADFNLICGLLLDLGVDPDAAKLIENISFGRNAIIFSKILHALPDADSLDYPHSHMTARKLFLS